jgi:hypothetical protein
VVVVNGSGEGGDDGGGDHGGGEGPDVTWSDVMEEGRTEGSNSFGPLVTGVGEEMHETKEGKMESKKSKAEKK